MAAQLSTMATCKWT